MLSVTSHDSTVAFIGYPFTQEHFFPFLPTNAFENFCRKNWIKSLMWLYSGSMQEEANSMHLPYF